MSYFGRFEITERRQLGDATQAEYDQEAHINLTDLMAHPGSIENGNRVEIQPCFASTSNEACSPKDVRILGSILRHNISKEAINSNKRHLLIDTDEISRSGICISLAFLASKHYFKTFRILYSERKYKVNGDDLRQKLATQEFWNEVFNYPSRLMAVPMLSGRYDASKNKSVFVSGGLDFARVTHLASRWEPHEVLVTKATAELSGRDEELLSRFDGIVGTALSLERTDIDRVRDALANWWSNLDCDELQPLLICGGWKLHAITACLWAIENGAVPTFVCLPDFISNQVTASAGDKWDIIIRDSAVIV